MGENDCHEFHEFHKNGRKEPLSSDGRFRGICEIRGVFLSFLLSGICEIRGLFLSFFLSEQHWGYAGSHNPAAGKSGGSGQKMRPAAFIYG
jgi:hypothetical protein